MKKKVVDLSDFPKCPKCGSSYTMYHQWDDRYKICMSCKYNWKDDQEYPSEEKPFAEKANS